MNAESGSERISTDSLGGYLKTQYFKEYWKKYQIQITFCDSKKELQVQPQGYLVNCNTYFRDIINNYGKATALPNLFFLDYGFGKEYYLAILPGNKFETNRERQKAIFIELNLKNARTLTPTNEAERGCFSLHGDIGLESPTPVKLRQRHFASDGKL